MTSYIVNIIREFLPMALITGTILALWRPVDGRKIIPQLSRGVATGLIVGGILYIVALDRLITIEVKTFLHAVNIFLAFLVTITCILSSKRQKTIQVIGRIVSKLFIASLIALATFSFLTFMSDQALSVTYVLNTSLILNLGAILIGILLMGFLVTLTMHLNLITSRDFALGFLTVISAILTLKLSAEVILGMMQMEVMALTGNRLSFVAKIIGFSYLFPYIQIALLGVLSLIFFVKRPVFKPHYFQNLPNAERRKAHSRVLLEIRWFKAAVMSIVIVVSPLLYYDIYASKPLKISTPTPVAPYADGLIKLKIDDVKDGKLHRFSYVMSDGHAVRFFVINRYKEHIKIGVAYDACMICGDTGYIQKGNEVICIACNVRIFVPSIGKAGGCNPIPLNHKVTEDYIIVRAEELGRGAKYFSD